MGSCQDEPDPLDDWNRIAELQQRNRVCPPHLKTSYPLESRVSEKPLQQWTKVGPLPSVLYFDGVPWPAACLVLSLCIRSSVLMSCSSLLLSHPSRCPPSQMKR